MHPTRATITQLAELIRMVEQNPRNSPRSSHGVQPAVSTGWSEVDGSLPGGLLRGAAHEWCGVGILASTPPPGEKPPAALRRLNRQDWTPPLCILTHLAWQALGGAGIETAGDEASSSKRRKKSGATASPWAEPGTRVLWVGRRCWPYGRGLVRMAAGSDPTSRPPPVNVGIGAADRPWHQDHRLLRRSIFIDPPDLAARIWTIELALRSPAVSMVVADGSGLNIAATRRLQLAAEAGLSADAGAIALLARPPDEERELSVAVTRWRVSIPPPAVPGEDLPRGKRLGWNLASPGGAPRWAVALLRCRGAVASISRNPSHWLVEWRHEKGLVFVSADVADRPGSATADAGAIGRRGA
jgi:hypothetical protein